MHMVTERSQSDHGIFCGASAPLSNRQINHYFVDETMAAGFSPDNCVVSARETMRVSPANHKFVDETIAKRYNTREIRNFGDSK